MKNYSFFYVQCHLLEVVVLVSKEVVSALSDYSVGQLRHLIPLRVAFLVKTNDTHPCLKLAYYSLWRLKTWHYGLFHHYRDKSHQIVHILTDFKETSGQQALEIFEEVTIDAIHELYVFLRELERSSLETHITRTVLQHESEINMYNMALAIDHNVTVVAISDLE